MLDTGYRITLTVFPLTGCRGVLIPAALIQGTHQVAACCAYLHLGCTAGLNDYLTVPENSASVSPPQLGYFSCVHHSPHLEIDFNGQYASGSRHRQAAWLRQTSRPEETHYRSRQNPGPLN